LKNIVILISNLEVTHPVILQIYVRFVRPWNLQTLRYLFCRWYCGSIFIHHSEPQKSDYSVRWCVTIVRSLKIIEIQSKAHMQLYVSLL